MKDTPLTEVKETLKTLTAALVDITTQVDHLTHGEFRSLSPAWEQDRGEPQCHPQRRLRPPPIG